MADTDLLPCPFCGWGARLEARVSEKLPPEYHAACFGDCEVSPSVWRASEAAAIAAWNRRAPSPSPAPCAVEALRQLAYERAKDAYGHEIADALASNGWRWSDTAPDFIDTSLYRAVAALASLSQPAKGEREGGRDD